MGEAEPYERVIGAPVPLGRGHAGVQQPVGDVLPHGGVFGQEELLEDEPDLPRPGSLESWRLPSRAASTPPIRTTPLVGRSSVPMTCSSVDLPHPEGPTIAASAPGRTEKDTPRRAGTGGSSS